jgi:hypothetical protein
MAWGQVLLIPMRLGHPHVTALNTALGSVVQWLRVLGVIGWPLEARDSVIAAL